MNRTEYTKNEKKNKIKYNNITEYNSVVDATTYYTINIPTIALGSAFLFSFVCLLLKLSANIFMRLLVLNRLRALSFHSHTIIQYNVIIYLILNSQIASFVYFYTCALILVFFLFSLYTLEIAVLCVVLLCLGHDILRDLQYLHCA